MNHTLLMSVRNRRQNLRCIFNRLADHEWTLLQPLLEGGAAFDQFRDHHPLAVHLSGVVESDDMRMREASVNLDLA